MEAKGAGKLKLIGVLFIILGAIGAVVSVMALAGGGLIMGLGASTGEVAAVVKGSTILMVTSGIRLIWSIVLLVAGILGVKDCKAPEKAKTLFALGGVLIIFSLAANILSIVAKGINVVDVIGLVVGCVLPVIFMLGAKENMNAR
ncbi:MAG: hypothetical protein PHG16_08395 [Lachnospiraceae bacterium]|nr:hypothetical protein [Lachnospiraceae bacterium]